MANSKVQRARTQLAMMEPFFSTILFRHEMIETNLVPFAAVTPRGQILYNPECEKTLTVEQIVFLLAHEVLHIVYDHAGRQNGRNHQLWNIASDMVINETLIALGVGRFIEGGMRYDSAEKMTSEQVYDCIKDESPYKGMKGYGESGEDKKKKGKGGGSGLPNEHRDLVPEQGCAGDDDPLKEASEKYGKGMTDDEKRIYDATIKQEIAQATVAAKMQSRNMGSGMGDFLRRMEDLVQPPALPWYEQLERFMTHFITQGNSWKRPNKRFSHVYLPTTDKLPAMGPIVIGIDTSGSISEKELGAFAKHINDLVEDCRPEKVFIVYCDYEINRVDTFELGEPIEMSMVGGGGTDMTQICRWVKELCDEDVDACVIFTDGYTPYPEKHEMTVPTKWVLTTEYCTPDYIDTIRFSLEDL